MPKITGRVYDIGLSGSRGTMWLSAGFRTGTEGVVAPRRVPYAIVGGELPDDVIVDAGPAYLEIDVGIDANGGWPVIIPEHDVTLRELFATVYDWTSEELSAFAQLRAEAVAAAGRAESAASAADADRVQTGLDRVATGGDRVAAAGSASAAASSAGAAAVSAQDALDAASGVPAALAGKADLVDGLVPESQLPELGAPGVMVTDVSDDPRDAPTAGDGAVTVGYGATAGDSASAVGTVANATGVGASAVGTGANAGGHYSAAVGTGAQASGFNASAVGTAANAGGDYSAAVGAVAQAPNHFQVTLGGHFPGENGDPTYQHEVHVPGVLVLYSPDRSMWAITVDNTGTISAAPWTPPNISPM